MYQELRSEEQEAERRRRAEIERGLMRERASHKTGKRIEIQIDSVWIQAASRGPRVRWLGELRTRSRGCDGPTSLACLLLCPQSHVEPSRVAPHGLFTIILRVSDLRTAVPNSVLIALVSRWSVVRRSIAKMQFSAQQYVNSWHRVSRLARTRVKGARTRGSHPRCSSSVCALGAPFSPSPRL